MDAIYSNRLNSLGNMLIFQRSHHKLKLLESAAIFREHRSWIYVCCRWSLTPFRITYSMGGVRHVFERNGRASGIKLLLFPRGEQDKPPLILATNSLTPYQLLRREITQFCEDHIYLNTLLFQCLCSHLQFGDVVLTAAQRPCGDTRSHGRRPESPPPRGTARGPVSRSSAPHRPAHTSAPAPLGSRRPLRPAGASPPSRHRCAPVASLAPGRSARHR